MASSSVPSNSASCSGTKEIVEWVEEDFDCFNIFDRDFSGCDIPCLSQHSFSVPIESEESVLRGLATVSVDEVSRGSEEDSSSGWSGVENQFDAHITFRFLNKEEFPLWKVTVKVDGLDLFDIGESYSTFYCISGTTQSPVDLMQQDLRCSLTDNYSDEFFKRVRYGNSTDNNYHTPDSTYTDCDGYDRPSHSAKIYFKLKCTITIPKTSKPTPTVSSFRVRNFPETPKEKPSAFESYGSQALNDFEALLYDSSTADMEIQVVLEPEKIFHCHKAIVAARSSGFKGIIKNLTETQGRILELKDISSPAMGHFLSFLYCGRFQDDSWIQSLPELVYASKKYGVNALRELCDIHLIQSVTRTNALELGKLASQHKMTNAVADIRKFIAKNIEDISFEGCDISNSN